MNWNLLSVLLFKLSFITTKDISHIDDDAIISLSVSVWSKLHNRRLLFQPE